MYRILFVSIFIFLSNEVLFADQKQLPDSLVTIENVYVYCLSDPDKAQQIIDRLRELNDEKLAFDYEIDWAQGDLYFNTGKFTLASYYFERVKEYDKVKSNRKFLMGLLSTMLECYKMNNNQEKAMQTAIELLKITEADSIKEETGRAYQYMGEIFNDRMDSLAAEKYFDMAEIELKESENIPYLYHFYTSYANLLLADKQYAHALDIIQKAELILDKVATDPSMMPEGYDNYEYSRFKAFAADIFAKNGKMKEAEEYYKQFEEQHLPASTENDISIVPYLLTTQRFEKAIAISHERETYLRQYADTIGDNMQAVKAYLAMAYSGLKQYDKAAECLKQQLSIEEQLRSRQLNSVTQELAVIYETEKKDAKLKKKEAEALQNRILVAALTAICLFALLVAIIAIRNQKNTKRNNLLMVRQIKELQQIRKSPKDPVEDDNLIQESDLFAKLENLMKHDKMYQDPVCSRDLIMNKLGIDKNTLLELQHANNIDNLPEYINRFRLEEAIRLLENENDLSIEQVAQQAGFGSARSLQRQFKEKYNMSPGEYRRLSKK